MSIDYEPIQEERIKKIEEGFHTFQKEWKRFLEIDFHRLVVSVDMLMRQAETIKQNMEVVEKQIDVEIARVKLIKERAAEVRPYCSYLLGEEVSAWL